MSKFFRMYNSISSDSVDSLIEVGECCQNSRTFASNADSRNTTMIIWGMVISFFLLFASSSFAAEVGDTISNTATVSYKDSNLDKNSSSNSVDYLIEKSKAQIQLFRLAEGAGGNEIIGQSSYQDSNGNWHTQPSAHLGDGTAVDISTHSALQDAPIFDANDLMVLKVIDSDQNTNANVVEFLEVTVVTSSGDTETLRLVETGPNTGVFTGYLNLTTQSSGPKDGLLHVNVGDKIDVSYLDNGNLMMVDSAEVVPYSHVFLAQDGTPLPNMEVTLVRTSVQSKVYKSSKSTHQKSGTIEKRVITNNKGEFRFGIISQGTYRIEVKDPNQKYFFPSVYMPTELTQYGYTSKNILSYGEGFVHNGGPLQLIDIPVDNERAVIWVEKEVNKIVSSVGELLKYTLTLHNDGTTKGKDLILTDHLPLGLKYIKESSKLNGQKVIPEISADGKNIIYKVPLLEKTSSKKITFVTEVTAGVVDGEVTNRAWLEGFHLVRSREASVTTKIEEELTRSHGIIMGQVYECAYADNKKGHGIANVRLYLENGTYVSTDRNGKYHIEGVEAGTHVVQIDKELLPSGYVMGDNPNNSRFAGRDFSQFVNMGRGALKRTDFCLDKIVVYEKVEVAVKGAEENRTKPASKVADIFDNTEKSLSTEMPKYTATSANRYKGKEEIIWPPEGYIPGIPSIGIAIAHDKVHKAKVFLNGGEVNILNFNGEKGDINASTVIDVYKGVDLLNQANTIVVRLYDGETLVKTLTRELHVSTVPVRVEYVPKSSSLLADGIHPPVIAVRFIDADGKPLRAGATGVFSVDFPHRSQSSIDLLQNDPLNINNQGGGSDKYTIDSNGIAYIKLQPTTQSGTVSLHFNIFERDEVIRAWLKPKLREWIMVGFAEGSVGYNTLKGHKESLNIKGAKEKVVTEGRVSFFAKGKVKGKWLLTMAYDSGKDTKNSKFFDQIDPSRYYTLYNDGSLQNYEAASRKKLYLKIEKDNFSAMFGDFNTDMTVTELSMYSRNMTGVKSEYHGDKVEAVAFVANTENIFARDELRGDGTSGYYHLKNREIEENSERVVIEVRDRYHSEKIIETKVMQRFRDYEIDYNRGTLYFKEPVYSNDKNFNPRYIVVNYETNGDGSKHYTYGGRVAYKSLDNAKIIGASYIHEDNAKKKSELYGVDTTVKLSTSTIIKAEYAKTKTTQDGNTTYGDAKLLEVEYVDNGIYARAYYREQDDSFGLGQTNASLGATRKIGIDASKTFVNRMVMRGTAYRDESLLTNEHRDVAEFRTEINNMDWSAYTGYRYANATQTSASHQMLFGATYALFDQRLRLHVAHDQTFGKDEDEVFPTRTEAGFDVALRSDLSLFGNYEWAKGLDEHELGRLGMRYRPWSGMTLENATESEYKNDVTRVYNTIGAIQTFNLGKHWNFNIGLERGEIVDGNMSKEYKDFNAYRLGIGYMAQTWSATINGEYRDAKDEEKQNVTAGVYVQQSSDLAFALSGGYNKLEDLLGEGNEEDADLRISLAYRPEETDYIILEKLDLVHTKHHTKEENFYTQKIINNLLFNYTPNQKTEISLQHGFKYVIDTIDEYEHKGVTQLFGVDSRYDVSEKVEVGLQTSILYAQKAENWDYGFGLYIGYNIFDNMVLTLGYNWDGFEDRDFSLQTYRIEGPYLQFKMKFDQENLKDIVRKMSW